MILPLKRLQYMASSPTVIRFFLYKGNTIYKNLHIPGYVIWVLHAKLVKKIQDKKEAWD